MPQRVRFTGLRQAEVESFELPALGPDQVHVRVSHSLLSTGTEGIVYARLFDAGTHWDGWVEYPFFPGYAVVGRIVAVGAQVRDRGVGQVVAVRRGHASDVVAPAAETYPVPDGVDVEQATWFAMAKIASHGALRAAAGIGQSVAIVGAGPIGQMATRWLAAGGVETLIVVDPVAARLAMARAGGATAVVAKPADQAKADVWAATPDGQGPDAVIEVTGHPAVFAPTLALPRRLGRVVLLGDTGRPAEQRLSYDVVIRGLTIVGAHDGHNDDHWNNARAVRAFFALVAAGRFPLDGLVTHRFAGADAAKAYALADTQRSQTMGIVLNWQ